MRIRNKLLLAITVPVGLLVLQIVLVNYFIRESQNAVSFISATHATIEEGFRAAELVTGLRAEAKKLPSSFVTDGTEGTEGIIALAAGFERLQARVSSINASETARQAADESMTALNEAFDELQVELTATEETMSEAAVDMNTLLERAIYLDASLVALSSALGGLTRDLRGELQNAVDRERVIHNRPVIAGIAIGGLSVFMLLVFTWLVVDRYFVARLTRLSSAMRSIAGGDLRAYVPEATGQDEIADMAEALTVFRDTAVEVEENNLRQVAEARQRLVDAIESIAEGFSLYDKNDLLVLCNRQYQDLVQPDTNEALKTGSRFSDVVQTLARNGQIKDAHGREDEWLAERMNRHQDPSGPFIQHHADGKWIEITEHKTSDGGTVAIYADITRQKQSELALLEAKRRTEAANDLVTRKNATLEGLSAQLSKYLSPQIYSSIFSGEQTVEIASKRKKLSILFSDIVGFTETADMLESEELTTLLNNYLTEMSDIALRNGATVDKYIGDEIMMFFGDPDTRGVSEDAIACVRTAVEMQARSQYLERKWLDMGIETPFRMRIGINTGYCTVGNFGSEDRMDYTIIGNEVNLAARLQTLADPGQIVIAHETYALVRHSFTATEAPMQVVKGFDKPVRNYVVDQLSSVPDEAQPSHSVSKRGLRVSLEIAEMSPAERAEAIAELERLIDYLEVDE